MTEYFSLLPRLPALHRTFPAVLAAGLAAALAGCGSLSLPSAGPVKERNGAWVGLDGKSLYTNDRDPADSNRSTCTGDCAREWPPLAADADAIPQGAWQVLKRGDGVWQWTYQGKPVYFHAKDRLPGDRLGDGVGGTWRLARP
jgi:predicted lipoprotein with Yx(FWY)xxD motif